MPQAQGIVESIAANGQAKILVEPDDACGPCEAKGGGCGCSGARSKIAIKAHNDVGATIGDRVMVDYKPGALMKSLLVFLGLPAVGLISGIVFGVGLEGRLVLGVNGTLLVAIAGLAGGIAASILSYRRIVSDIQPFVSRILRKAFEVPEFLKNTVDPVCKMEVNPAMAAGRIAYQGKNFYFCHSNCMERFMKDPARYVKSLEGGGPNALVSIGTHKPL
jgi:YHS domain-containing protein/positive regulator of sigma E activity